MTRFLHTTLINDPSLCVHEAEISGLVDVIISAISASKPIT